MAPYLVLTSMISALLREVGETPISSVVQLFAWAELLVANILSILVCWLAIEALNLTVLKNKDVRPLPVGVVFGLSFFIGALKGLTTGLFGLWLGAFPTTAIAIEGRWLQGGVLGILSIPLLTLSVAKLHQINQKREVLIADHVRSLLLGKLAPTESLRLQMTELKSKSLDLLDDLDSAIASSDTKAGSLFQATIQNLLTNHIRPMSHTIWQDKARRIPKQTISTLLRTGIRSPSLNPLVTAAPLFIALFMGHLALLTPAEAAQRSLVMALTPALVAKAYGLIKMQSNSIYITWYLVLQVSAAALGVGLSDLIFGQVPSGSFVLAWLATSLLSVQSILMGTIGHQMIREDRDLNLEIEALLEGNKVESSARSAYSELLNRDYAQFLHSDVQNQLLISALAARQPNFNDQDLKAEVNRLRILLANLDTERPSVAEMSFVELVETLATRWEGFIALNTSVCSSLEGMICKKGWALVEVLNEAISNAIRHGMASTISIEIQPLEDSILVTVSDNGMGPTSGKRGLGLKIIQEITQGRWSIQPGPKGGAVLKLQLTNVVG